MLPITLVPVLSMLDFTFSYFIVIKWVSDSYAGIFPTYWHNLRTRKHLIIWEFPVLAWLLERLGNSCLKLSGFFCLTQLLSFTKILLLLLIIIMIIIINTVILSAVKQPQLKVPFLLWEGWESLFVTWSKDLVCNSVILFCKAIY